MTWFRRSAAPAALALVLFSGLAIAQTAPMTPDTQSLHSKNAYAYVTTQVSPQVLHYLFITYVGYQDDRKREAQDAGQDPSKISDDYRPILRSSDDDVTQMLRITVAGYRTIKEKEEDEKAASVAYRAQYSAKERAHMPVPDNIKQLEQDRWKLVDQTMDELKNSLGEETYNRLDKWIIATWGPHTSIRKPVGDGQPDHDPQTVLSQR